MPLRNWLSHPPVGVGIGIVFILTIAVLIRHQDDGRRAYEATRQEYESSKRVVTKDATTQRPYTGEKSYREEWRAERDLDAQRSMAESAYWTAVAAWVGAILIGLTLWEATRTTLAAAEATRQTARAVDVQTRLEKAFVHPEDVVADYSVPNQIVVRLKNSGRTVGVLIDGVVQCALSGSLPTTVSYGGATSLDQQLLPVGGTHPLFGFLPSGASLEGVLLGEEEAVVWGYVRYEDVFGRTWRRGFGYSSLFISMKDDDGTIESETVGWSRAGGDDYNYDRQEAES